jgi:putative ABC transport system substrate-binding protein
MGIANDAEGQLRFNALKDGLNSFGWQVDRNVHLDIRWAAGDEQMRVGALVINNGSLFLSQIEHLAALTVRHAVPAISAYREFAAAGGLMSYGGSLTDAYRLTAVNVSRILKGERPADLPVQQATKVEMFINLKTAKALGLTVPQSMRATADDVIE